ncbi:DnaJ domain [Melia azedarach]|uniref:DnaJ domain n=1 Tax=Melia azedarach TaxID=155640 RepID=A0ACC1XYC2_MELAZ|nr:DnaJ domain [Melia azedarach]
MIHHLAVITKSWYGILAVEDHGAGVDKIKKHYKGRLKQLDKCSSMAADSAVKLVHEAWEVLSDAKRREAYDMLMGYNHVLSSSKRTSEIQVASKRSRNPSPASSSSSSSPWGYEQQASKKRKTALE